MEPSAASGAEFKAWKAPTFEALQAWIGWRVTDVNGSAIGHVESVLRDERGEPSWLVVSEFRLGDGRRFLIPVRDAVGGGGHVWSPHGREHIRRTARITGPRVTPQAQRRLKAHYRDDRHAA
jgi:PRC-barrel domain protein